VSVGGGGLVFVCVCVNNGQAFDLFVFRLAVARNVVYLGEAIIKDFTQDKGDDVDVDLYIQRYTTTERTTEAKGSKYY